MHIFFETPQFIIKIYFKLQPHPKMLNICSKLGKYMLPVQLTHHPLASSKDNHHWKKLPLKYLQFCFFSHYTKFVKVDTKNVHNYLVQPLHKPQCKESQDSLITSPHHN